MNSLSVPATIDSLARIASFVKALARAAGLSARQAYGLRLAVEEFAANIVLYAYPGAAEPGGIDLRAEVDDNAVTVTIEDTGIPFDPSQSGPAPDPHLPVEQRKPGGLGVHLALHSIDRFLYKRVGGRNQSVLVVYRTQAPGDSLFRRQPRGSPLRESLAMSEHKGTIGVLTEAHFDEEEYQRFGEFFPARGYAVEYLSHLWGVKQLTFKGNDHLAEMTVTMELNDAALADYVAIILIGGFTPMDRLRFELNPVPGRPNQSPGVRFLRKAVAEMDRGNLRIGAICHGLWLFCAAPELLKGRKVTCAHNILYDVLNAGGVPIFAGSQLADTWVDKNLITGRHPGVVKAFMEVFATELDKARGVGKGNP